MKKEEIKKRVRLLKVEAETLNTMLENFEAQLAETEKLEKLDKLLEKPFKEYDADKYATGIMIRDAKIRIYACTGQDCKKEDCSCGLFLKEAEDFYNALGHAIAELKRKQG